MNAPARILLALRAALGGVVTDRYLIAIAGTTKAGFVVHLNELRKIGYKIYRARNFGYYLKES